MLLLHVATVLILHFSQVHGECCYEGNDSAFCKLFQAESKTDQEALRYYFNDDCSELENEFSQDLNEVKALPIVAVPKEMAPELQYDTGDNENVMLNTRAMMAAKKDYASTENKMRNFLRFGKRVEQNFYRYSRDRHGSAFLRDAKSAHGSKPNFLRFGKRQFSRRSPINVPFGASLVRDHKGGPNFLRFG